MIDRTMPMLINALEFISKAESITSQEAFHKLLDWCAVKIGIDGVFSSMKSVTSETLKDIVDLNLLKDTADDWFGILYEIVFEIQLQSLESWNKTIEDHKIKETHGFTKSILFETVETGRPLLATYNKYGNEFLLYGIEKDILKYHIALVNIKLFNIPAFVINVDIQEGKNFNTSSENWRMSNIWNAPKAKWFN